MKWLKVSSLYIWIVVSILFHYALFQFVVFKKENSSIEQRKYEVKLVYYMPPAEIPKPVNKIKKKMQIVKEKMENKMTLLKEEDEINIEEDEKIPLPEEYQQESEGAENLPRVEREMGLVQKEVTPARDLTALVQEFRKQILKKKIYPVAARKKGQQGVVHVLIELDKEGNLVELQVTQSSGYKVLDKSAISLIKRATPFKHGADQSITIEMPIKYSLVNQ